MKFICYPKCSTCKKAQNWLDENKIEYEFRDIKIDNPNYTELKKWYGKSDLPIKRFFNTSGMAYRELNLKDKLPKMTEDEMLKLLATDGMLVKRPLVIGDDFILVGFKQTQWEEKFLK
ncbi:MAG: arsenate reductase family protein [Clostridia bacterium]|nr:arsenate reductase family protein [Clostridia bacterium]